MSSSAQPLSLQEQNKHLVIRWFEEVWNQGRRETIFELFPADAVLHDGQNHIHGSEAFCRFQDSIRAEFSDFHISPVIALAEGDLVCVHWAADLRHTASSQPLKITGTSVVRVQNARFTEAWQNWDAAALAAQLASSNPAR
jgi:predicted SnoaL-like aldol condensation-catalyzing enzyme